MFGRASTSAPERLLSCMIRDLTLLTLPRGHCQTHNQGGVRADVEYWRGGRTESEGMPDLVGRSTLQGAPGCLLVSDLVLGRLEGEIDNADAGRVTEE